jgi:hypothetical protein
MDEMEQFFINYNKMRGRVFKPIASTRRGRGDEVGEAHYCKSRKEKTLLEVPSGKTIFPVRETVRQTLTMSHKQL